MKNFFDKCINAAKKQGKIVIDLWMRNIYFSSSMVFIATFLMLALLYFFIPGISSIDDHFFHFKLAYLLRTEGLDVVGNFDWIYLTNATQEHIRYSLSLFNISLIPFTYFQDLIFGLKVSDAFWGSLSVGIFYFVLRRINVKFPFLFTVIVFSSTYLVMRLLLGRAYVLIAAFVFLEMYFAIEKKYKKLFLVCLLHVFWHQATFFMPIVISLIVEIARYLVQYKFFFKNLVAGFLASIVGMSIYPGFPMNLWSWAQGIINLQIAVVHKEIKGEGSELYTRDLLKILDGSNIFLLLLMLGFSVVIFYYVKSRQKGEKFIVKKGDNLRIALYAGFLFLLMSLAGTIFVSGRFYDFYFFGIIFLVSICITILLRDKKIILDQSLSKYVSIALVVFFLFLGANTLINRRIGIALVDYANMKPAAEWVASKSNNGDLVYLNNWSDFPVAFFYNSKNVYTMGIEPRALLEYDSKLYWKWYNMFQYTYYCEKEDDCGDEWRAENERIGKISKDEQDTIRKENSRKIIESIRNDFGARYIIAAGPLGSTIMLNEDLVEDKFESKSEINNSIIRAFKLK